MQDWFGRNLDKTKYGFMNKIIIKIYIKLYIKFQKEQNDRVHRVKNRIEVLLKEVEEILANYADTDKIGIKAYL